MLPPRPLLAAATQGLAAVCAAAPLAAVAPPARSSLVITAEVARPAGPDVPVLPALGWDNPDWTAAAPIWEATRGDRHYRARAGAAPEGFLLEVTARDPDHPREFRERNIWRGDCLYLALDARGDFVPDGTVHAGIDPDEAVLIYGLGSDGPDAWIADQGNPTLSRTDVLATIRQLERDDAAGRTTYRVAVPWRLLRSGPGHAPTIGIALTIKDPGLAGETNIDWGTAGTFRREPRVLHALALPDVAGDLASFVPLVERVAAEDAVAEVAVAIRRPTPAVLEAALGPARAEMPLAAGRLHRLRVTIPAPLVGPDARDLTLRLREGDRLVGEETVALASPDTLLADLRQRVERLAAGAEPLVRDHLAATLRIVSDARAGLGLPRRPTGRDPDEAALFFDVVGHVLDTLPADRLDLDAYRSTGRPLTLAFRSSRDYSLQFYGLQLPHAWDAAAAYPLIVYLHGAGPGHPLQGLRNNYDNGWQDTLFRNEPIDPAAVPPIHRGFIVSPWARGNSGYTEYAESDVWEILDLVRTRFRIDADRIYLSGFSMGCQGSLLLAAHRPDVWAGVNLAAGFHGMAYWRDNPLLDNLAGLPLSLWVGDLDTRMRDGMTEFVGLAGPRGFVFTSRVVPNLPHTYPYAEYNRAMESLLARPRSRPSTFSFVAAPGWAGTRGISVRVPAVFDATRPPRFTATVREGVVEVTTENTGGLHLDPDRAGVPPGTTLIVRWNGEIVHDGERRVVTAGVPFQVD